MTSSKPPIPTKDHVMKRVAQMRPIFKVAKLFGGNIRTQVEEIETQFAEVERMAVEQVKFGERFGPRGWTIFDRLSVDAVRAAVLEDDDDVAERGLTTYHLNPDILNFLGYRFHVSRFEPWQELYERAVERAKEEDFISAVPLVLIIIDGICTAKTQKHPFSGGADAPVFDTATTAPGGLPSGLAVLGATRRKLDVSQITSPYRHGILHGLNPNYGNALVAAKAFNLLQAMVDYFDKREDEAVRLARAADEQRERSLPEIAQMAASTKDMKKRIEAWAARPPVSGVVAEHGSPHSLEDGSPEEVAAKFLDAVVARNFGKIAALVSDYGVRPINLRAKFHREELGKMVLDGWRIVGVRDEAPAVSEVVVELEGRYQENSWSGTQTMRLMFGDDKYDPMVRGAPGGSWAVRPNFLTNLWGTATRSLADRQG